LSLLLQDGRAANDLIAAERGAHAEFREVARTQLAVDR
jgi:hypothetical protein